MPSEMDDDQTNDLAGDLARAAFGATGSAADAIFALVGAALWISREVGASDQVLFDALKVFTETNPREGVSGRA